VRGYLDHLKPDGVLILHLSNRNLDLDGPAQSLARAVGAYGLIQKYQPATNAHWDSAEDAVIIGKSKAAIARYAADRRWAPADPLLVRPWTDDYTNLIGALWRRLEERWAWLP